ncbi:MAG: hypothetical protein MUP90_04855 [Gammaproteobacteria bacterium]|nr:hypothetical protein [Gammaproteobacteria bacterium]
MGLAIGGSSVALPGGIGTSRLLAAFARPLVLGALWLGVARAGAYACLHLDPGYVQELFHGARNKSGV